MLGKLKMQYQSWCILFSASAHHACMSACLHGSYEMRQKYVEVAIESFAVSDAFGNISNSAGWYIMQELPLKSIATIAYNNR